MKKFFAFMAAFLALFCFAGCGEYKPPVDQGTTVPPVTDDPDPETPVDSETVFTVSLLYQGELFAPQETIYAQWTEIDGASVYRAAFDATGVARITGLDGDYRVTLSATPAGYTYNPNIYTADNDERRVSVTLLKLTPTSGTGTDFYQNVIRLAATGAYRTTVSSPDQTVYFQYEPSKSGLYSMQSIIDVTANEINPILDVYHGTAAYKPTTPTETIDTGGDVGSYTKNFRWEIQHSGATTGSVYAFGLRAQGVTADAFPVTIDFILDCDGEYSGEVKQYTQVRAAEELVQMPDYDATFRSVATLRANNVLDASFFQLNPEDGFYHFYDAVTDTYGGILYAKISVAYGVYDTPLTDPRVSKKIGDYDYSLFVDDYAAFCNSDGVYAVTDELQQFLQGFAVAQRLFNDGNGWAEKTYNSSEDNQWLFACGYYEIGIELS